MMGRIALLFPGQGSQYVGMGKDWYDGDEHARRTFDLADHLLGFKLSRICFEGPTEEIRQTRNTQPAIFVHSMVVAKSLSGLDRAMAAGHSLGEYSALVAAGALSFEDGLKLVRLRGELMQDASEREEGTMAAIVGLSPEDIERVCAEASQTGVVQPANFNSPGQIVISGSADGVRKGMELARVGGAKLVKELVVGGAFHSPLMEVAREGLKKALDATIIRDAEFPVYTNVTAEPVRDASEIRDLLYKQLTRPVLWEKTIRNMVRDGATEFRELGPGKVLQGLARRIDSSVVVRGVDTMAQGKEIAVS